MAKKEASMLMLTLMLMLMLMLMLVIAIESEMGDQGRKAETLKAKSHVCFARRRIPNKL